jgi:hypothetical protein
MAATVAAEPLFEILAVWDSLPSNIHATILSLVRIYKPHHAGSQADVPIQ